MTPFASVFGLPMCVRQALVVPGQHTHGELAFLHQLFAGSRAHVEVGTYCGASALAATGSMACGGRVTLVDPFVPDEVTGLKPGWYQAVLAATVPYIERAGSLNLVVRCLPLTSTAAATLFRDEEVDSVYLDADHSLESVREDILNWLPKVRPGGILAGHDYAEMWPGVQKALEEVLPGHLRGQERVWYYQKPNSV